MIPSRLLGAVLVLLLGTNLGRAVVKVACIGDSITAGSFLANPALESYPAKLQRLLGAEYEVRNYGVSGRTLLRKGDYPYWVESAFTQSHDWSPDLVTIMLGTNDGKPYNWRYGTNFLTDYTDLIASYTNLSSHPRILICTPCPVFGTGGYDIKPGIIATNVTPLVQELGATLGVEIIELQTLLAGHKEWFPDTVHPNTRGTTVLAALFRTALVGRSPDGTAPDLALTTLPAKRAELSWPLAWGGWVLQSTLQLRGTNTPWTVVELLAVNDGTVMRVTNSASNLLKLYRLWNPAP